MKAADVIASARAIQQDAGADYWPDAEMVKWLNEARLEAYRLRPQLFQVNEVVTLAPGARQEIPGGSRILFGVVRNISSKTQREVTPVDGAVLASHRPAWRSLPGAAEILHFMYDPTNPTEYDVYPPARLNPVVQVELSYAKLPAVVTEAQIEPGADPGVELVQEGEYAPALVDYVLYRSFLKEADTVPAFFQRAAQHLAACEATLQGSPQSAAANNASQG